MNQIRARCPEDLFPTRTKYLWFEKVQRIFFLLPSPLGFSVQCCYILGFLRSNACVARQQSAGILIVTPPTVSSPGGPSSRAPTQMIHICKDLYTPYCPGLLKSLSRERHRSRGPNGAELLFLVLTGIPSPFTGKGRHVKDKMGRCRKITLGQDQWARFIGSGWGI